MLKNSFFSISISPSSHLNNAIKIVYSIDALQNLIEEEKQEALTTLGNHYRSQLESLQDHIAEQKKKWSELKQSVSLHSTLTYYVCIIEFDD